MSSSALSATSAATETGNSRPRPRPPARAAARRVRAGRCGRRAAPRAPAELGRGLRGDRPRPSPIATRLEQRAQQLLEVQRVALGLHDLVLDRLPDQAGRHELVDQRSGGLGLERRERQLLHACANRVCASSRKDPFRTRSGRSAAASMTAERSVSVSNRSARSRVVRSAQWRSSIASTSGRVAPSASAHRANASCTDPTARRPRASSSRSTSCSRRIERIRPRYGSVRSCAAPGARRPALELGADRELGVRLLDPEPGPQELDEGTVRRARPVGDAPALEPGDVLPGERDELGEHPRLAQPGVPHDEHHLPAAGAKIRDRRSKRASSRSRPTRGVRDGGSETGRGPTRRDADTGSDRLHRTSPSGSSTNRSSRRDAVPGPTAIEPAGGALALLPRSWCRPARRSGSPRPDEPHRRRSAVDAHANVEALDPPRRLDLARVAGRDADDPCRPCRAFGIVLVGRGNAEVRADPVAHERLDHAAEVLDGATHPRDALPDERLDLVGPKPFAQAGRPDDVGEQGCDGALVWPSRFVPHPLLLAPQPSPPSQGERGHLGQVPRSTDPPERPVVARAIPKTEPREGTMSTRVGTLQAPRRAVPSCSLRSSRRSSC